MIYILTSIIGGVIALVGIIEATIKERPTVLLGVCLIIGFSIFASSAYFQPLYSVWSQELSGKAQLAKANQNRKIKVAEAQASLESAKFLNQAEVERAKGVAEANKIIGDSLRGNEAYLRYLWINQLKQDGQVIYIPTEAGLPILEAGKR